MTTPRKEDWIFRLRVPPQAAASKSVVELRQSQPPPTIETRSKTNRTSSSAVDATTNNDAARQERASLLLPAEQEMQERGTGWSFSSPYWSLSSDILLTVTFRPAWQGLPEYTNQLRCKTACCCCNSRTNRHAYVDFTVDTFTTKDIVKVEEMTSMPIKGIGDCQGIRIYLRPLEMEESDFVVPPLYETAFEASLLRTRANRQVLQEQQPSHVTMKEDDDANLAAATGPVLTFCLAKGQDATDPPLLWKVHLPSTATPIALETLTVLEGRLHKDSTLAANANADAPRALPTHIYLNGYQSWSFAGSVARGKPQPVSAMPDLFSRAFNAGGSPPPVATNLQSNSTTTTKPYYQSDFFTCLSSDGQVPSLFTSLSNRRFPYQQLDETGGPALVLGWLSQKQHLGVITADKQLEQLAMHVSGDAQFLVSQQEDASSGSITTDWAYCQLIAPHSYDEEPMVYYLQSVAAFHEARPVQNTLLTGWCSWYVFYERIHAQLLRDNLEQLAALKRKVPTNVAVVDDGYMKAWGDWNLLKKKEFPAPGLVRVAEDICQHDMRPGLWLAPFAADKHSVLAKEHKNWIIRNDAGTPANSSNCGKFFYGLDATNPSVRAHVHESIRRPVQDWKFDVLKIDFLYAACLEGNGRYDLSMTRAQAMDLAMQTIRRASGPDVFLIGCGCPLAAGIGRVDAMRVSADTGPTWYPALPLPWWDQSTLPALRSMIRNSLSRAPLGHRWWHNDPDCLMLGEHTRLTDEEVASAASVVAMTCGMLLLSDDLPKVSLKRLRILSKIFPLTGVTAVVLDLHSTNDGLPSLMRLWCTDKYHLADAFRDSMDLEDDKNDNDDTDKKKRDPNAMATFFARKSSFSPDTKSAHPNERVRSCVHVTKGLGTWTVLSISNWSDRTAVVHVPPHAIRPPPTTGWREGDTDETRFLATPEEPAGRHGYHVFGFWSSRYSWIPDTYHSHRSHRENNDTTEEVEPTISKKLAAHETEIFHVKPVLPDKPQYIGSDLHFTCGQEVKLLVETSNSVTYFLRTDYNRVGHVFVFLPRASGDFQATLAGERTDACVVATTPGAGPEGQGGCPAVGRILRVLVVIHADGRSRDGQVRIEF